MRIVKFYFTGTDTTKKTIDLFADVLAQDLGVGELVDYNYSRPAVRQARPCFESTDIVVSGLPTIAGRVPNLLLPYLNRIEGKGARSICISMYGNRNVDDCLLEHRDLLKKGGLQVIAGGAFVGEHSFSTRLAAKRPDAADMAQVTAFAKAVAEKVAAGDFSEPEMPGQVPYRPYYTPRDRNDVKINFIAIKPKTHEDLCIDCKRCAEICPLGSIDWDQVAEVTGKCMKCCGCIKKCPTGAKYFDDPGFLYHKSELEYLYADHRCEPVYYL